MQFVLYVNEIGDLIFKRGAVTNEVIGGERCNELLVWNVDIVGYELRWNVCVLFLCLCSISLRVCEPASHVPLVVNLIPFFSVARCVTLCYCM